MLQSQVTPFIWDRKPKYFSIRPLIDHWNAGRPLEWRELFGNGRPVDVEIGCGLGEFISRTAAVLPDRNFVGIEREWKRLAKTMRKIKTARLDNVRVLRLDAVAAFEHLFAPASIEKVYCLFPCPWPKKRHVKHRLFSQGFLRLLNSRLVSGGEVFIVTDFKPYVDWIREHIPATGFELAERVIGPQFDTKFERKWREAGQSEFFEMRLTKKRHVPLPLKEDAKVKRFYETGFAPERFRMDDYKDNVTVIFKELLFDEGRGRGMARVLVAEENLTQSVWIDIRKTKDKWRISLPEGQSVFPTAGVGKAIELVARAVKKSVAGAKI